MCDQSDPVCALVERRDSTSIFPPKMPKDSKIELGQSRQVKALAGKALSFQKRQLFTNICCIGLCPLIMVVLAATMGNIVSNLITRY